MAKISVIIPTYDEKSYLFDAIQSALDQTYSNLEVIVVDDASPINVDKIISEFSDNRLTHIKHEYNKGGSAARNTGIREANGQYIAFLDADDQWCRRKIEKQITRLEQVGDEFIGVHCERKYSMSVTNHLRDYLAEKVGTRNNSLPKEGGEELIKDILLMNFSTGASTLLVKKSAIDKIGGFDPTFKRHQDWEFLIRLLQHGKLAYVNEPLVIKNFTGEPDPATFEQGKQQLFSKFSDQILELEEAGYPITHVQNLHLAKMYIEHGNLLSGLSDVKFNQLTVPELFGLCWSVGVGIHAKASSSITTQMKKKQSV